MTVRTLIWRLEKMPLDAQVLVRDSGDIITKAEEVEHVAKLEEYPCAGFEINERLDAEIFQDGAVVIGRL